MNINKNDLITHIKKIRKEIGHNESDINIKELIFDKNTKELWIITPDRSDKSVIIGKGGWVVGKLKEESNLNKIHVESYSDFILKKYRMELSLNSLNSFISKYKENEIISVNKNSTDRNNVIPFENLKELLKEKIKNIYNFNFNEYFTNLKYNKTPENKNYSEKLESSKNHKAIVALSGGVDSSFSLILAKYLGFNPLAITIDPGTIILPKQFKQNINNLCEELGVEHEYLSVNYDEIMKYALNGKYHPCGRCSNTIETTLFNYAWKNNINVVIFGDMLSTGSQCITKQRINEGCDSKELIRLNLPATLSVGKEEIKNTLSQYNIEQIKGFGCPLLYEVHKNHPHMKKFSIQRILRETRSGALEPGEALNLIWSFYKLK